MFYTVYNCVEQNGTFGKNDKHTSLAPLLCLLMIHANLLRNRSVLRI